MQKNGMLTEAECEEAGTIRLQCQGNRRKAGALTSQLCGPLCGSETDEERRLRVRIHLYPMRPRLTIIERYREAYRENDLIRSSGFGVAKLDSAGRNFGRVSEMRRWQKFTDVSEMGNTRFGSRCRHR